MDILLCPIDSFANTQSDVVTFIKFSESFAVRSFSSFPGSGFGVAMMPSEVLMLTVV